MSWVPSLSSEPPGYANFATSRVRSSRGGRGQELAHRRQDRVADAVRAGVAPGLQELAQPRLPVLLAGRARGFDEAVRVEDEDVARPDVAPGLLVAGVGKEAEHRPPGVELGDVRGAIPASDQQRREVPRVDVAEPPRERLVVAPEHAGVARERGPRTAGGSAGRTPARGGDRLRPAADRTAPWITPVTRAAGTPLPETSPITSAMRSSPGAEDVVEVAAHLLGGPVDGGQTHGPEVVGAGRQQCGLHLAGDLDLGSSRRPRA